MMSNNVTEIINILKTCDSQKRIYHTLLRVHSDITTSEESLKQFVDKDGLKYVLEYLSKPNDKILNISLGILHNCCINPEIRQKILSEGIAKRLIVILRGVNQERIHYRCYKLTLNFIHYPSFCSTLISNNVHQLMVPVLEGDCSICTQLVAIRTVRAIWTVASKNEKKILAESNFIKSVMKYLQSTNKEVQKSVLKVILSVSRIRYGDILKQIFKEEPVLANVISQASEHPDIIFRIIDYISEIKYFHFFLAKAGALEAIFEHIRGFNFEKLDTEKENIVDLVLRCVCRLCKEPKCREKLCNISDAFSILLKIIELSSHVKFKKFSVLILASFIYDGYSIRRLVRQRLILVIVKYLQIVISIEGNVPHSKNGSKTEPPSSPISSGRLSPTSDSETSVVSSPTSERFDFSPALSSNSDYSPVCSPVIDDVDDETEAEEEDCEKLSVDDASSKADSPVQPQDDEDVKPGSEDTIFNLLKQLAFINEPQYDLCVQKSWETFLDYLVLVRKSTAQVTSLLCAIAGNKYFFNELLKSHFALAVHKKLCRPVHLDCLACQELDYCGVQILYRYQVAAETSYGIQIIRELLKNNCIQNKLTLTLTIPHIVRNFVQLEEYCLRHKALEYIVNSLDDDKTLLEEKVASLYSLATSLYLENPRIPCNPCKKCDVASLVKEGTISFLLDDGSTVTANKRTLCEKSEFFEAMFRCGFKEAKQSIVRLSNITSDCLRVLFRLLYSYCDCIVPRNVIILLELIVQSDRFLIPTLSEKLLNITMNSRLDYKNCHLIYDWAREDGRLLPSSDEWSICRNVIKYALTEEDMTFSQRVYSFKMLLRSKYKSAVLQDILQVMEHQLNCKDVKTKYSSKCFMENASKRFKLT